MAEATDLRPGCQQLGQPRIRLKFLAICPHMNRRSVVDLAKSDVLGGGKRWETNRGRTPGRPRGRGSGPTPACPRDGRQLLTELMRSSFAEPQKVGPISVENPNLRAHSSSAGERPSSAPLSGHAGCSYGARPRTHGAPDDLAARSRSRPDRGLHLPRDVQHAEPEGGGATQGSGPHGRPNPAASKLRSRGLSRPGAHAALPHTALATC